MRKFDAAFKWLTDLFWKENLYKVIEWPLSHFPSVTVSAKSEKEALQKCYAKFAMSEDEGWRMEKNKNGNWELIKRNKEGEKIGSIIAGTFLLYRQLGT